MRRALFGATIAGGFEDSLTFAQKTRCPNFRVQAGSRSDPLLRQPLQGGFRFLRQASLGGA
jgi:hypothetical protein